MHRHAVIIGHNIKTAANANNHYAGLRRGRWRDWQY